MRYHALVIPADPKVAPSVIHIGPEEQGGPAAIRAIVGVDEQTVMSYSRSGFTVTVDDYGAVREPRPPVNVRLIRLLAYPYNIYGNALIMGCDEAGNYADVPEALVLKAASA